MSELLVLRLTRDRVVFAGQERVLERLISTGPLNVSI